MKNLLLCGAALALAFSAHAQRVTTQALAVPSDPPISTWATAIESVFQHVDRSQVLSGILQEFAFSNIDVDPYDGQALTADNAADLSRWRRVYGGLYRARFGPNAPALPSSAQVNAALQPYAADDIVDLPCCTCATTATAPMPCSKTWCRCTTTRFTTWAAARPAPTKPARPSW